MYQLRSMHPIFLFRQCDGKYMREKTFISGLVVFFLLNIVLYGYGISFREKNSNSLVF